MIELPDFIRSKIQPEPNTGCWLWIAARSKGYGIVRPLGGEPTNAHRLVYKFYKGEIPDSLQLDHLCRVRCCVNPDHLKPVTSAENTRRGQGVAGLNALKDICCNGHSLADAHIRRGYRGNLRRDCRHCRIADNRMSYERYKNRIAVKGTTAP